jgi:PGF-pre-PGF domain-containing protein
MNKAASLLDEDHYNSCNHRFGSRMNKTSIMKNLTLLFVFFLSLSLLTSPVSADPLPFSGDGDGTESNPYQITTLDQLHEVRNDLNTYYVLMNDIDASATVGWNSGEGFVPVGNASNKFSGLFDGQGYEISGLYINRSTNYVGLFGATDSGASIKSVRLVDVDISGFSDVGGLIGINGGEITNSSSSGNVVSGNAGSSGSRIGGIAGSNDGGTIANSSSSGIVSTPASWAGGLVGENNGTISNSYSTADVSGDSYVGGLVGENLGSGGITGSYATGNITGDWYAAGGLVAVNKGEITNSYCIGNVDGRNNIGGLVGENNEGLINNSYSAGDVTGNDYVGGFAGLNWNDGVISNSHSTGFVTASAYNVGGFVGDNYATVSASYYNSDNTEQSDTGKGKPRTTAEMMPPYSSNTYEGWDFDNVWIAGLNDGYPGLKSLLDSYSIGGSGTEEDPYRIYCVNHLDEVRNNRFANYTLMNDIDASETETWNEGEGFEPIGDWPNTFTGTFDGQGYEISGLYIYRPSAASVGLFGFTASGSVIENVGIVDVNITGNAYVGGLVGENEGDTIAGSYVTGNITAIRQVGGLVGANYGGITDSYFSGNIIGSVTEATSRSIGGLTGYNCGDINNSYSAGTVSGYQFVGGLVGANEYCEIINSYSTADVNGYSQVGGLVGYDDGSTITATYSTGIVTGTIQAGGLVGYALGSEITESYWDTDTSGMTESDGGEGKTTSQMKQQSTFADWDFEDIWYIHSSINNGYPQLRYFIESYPSAESENNPSGSVNAGRSSGSRTSIGGSQAAEIIESSYSSIKQVLQGKAEYDFSGTDSPVFGISFDSRDNMGRVLAKVEVLNNAPQGVPSPSGNAFCLLSITVGSQGTVSGENADNIALSFRVNWEWVRENNIDSATIRIVRFYDGKWEDLPTTQLYDDGEMIYYTAQTQGFSIFGIVGDELKTVTDVAQPDAAAFAEEPVTSEEKKTPGFSSVLGLLVVSLAFLVLRKNKEDRN